MKNSIKRIAAATASAVMAISALSVSVSANSSDDYHTTYYWCNLSTEKFYDSLEEAREAGGTVIDVRALREDSAGMFSVKYPYYSKNTLKYYPTNEAALICSKFDQDKIEFGGPAGSPKKEGNYIYYSDFTKKYYTTYAEALKYASGYVYNASTREYYYLNGTTGTTAADNTFYGYYSTYTNKYYTTYNAALSASNNNPAYVRYAYYKSYNGSGNYYNSTTNTWYTTLAAALSASSNSSYGNISYTGTNFSVYYNSATGKYYATKSEAESANVLGAVTEYVVSNKAPSKTEYTYSSTPVYDYYNSPYYYYYYGYPYNYGYYNYNYYTNSTKAADGVPYVKGYQRYNSWTTLTKLVKTVKSGNKLTITMNGETKVPSSFLSAIDGKNVTVVFELDNGSSWTVNGKNVDSAKDVDLSVTYNVTDGVSSKLVKSAKDKNNGKIAAQFAVSDGFNTLGFTGKCSVKFSKDYAGSFAKAYIYDSDSNSLKLVSKSMVDSNGYTSFNASEGGVYLVVIF